MKRPVEVIQVVLGASFSLLIAGRAAVREQLSGGRVRNVEPVPVRAMNRDDALLPPREREGKRDRVLVIVAAVELESHLPGAEVDDLPVAAVVVDDGRDLAAGGGVQPPPQGVVAPRLVTGFPIDGHGGESRPGAGVGVKSAELAVLGEQQPGGPAIFTDGGEIDDGTGLFGQRSLTESNAEGLRTRADSRLAANSHDLADRGRVVREAYLADGPGRGVQALLTFGRARSAEPAGVQPGTDVPLDVLDPRLLLRDAKMLADR